MKLLRTLTISASLLAMLSACQGFNPTQKGQEARFKGNADMQKMLEAADGPDDIPTLEAALLKSAKESEAAGNYTNMVSYYAQLAENNPENKEYMLGLAEGLRRTGAYSPAIKAYQKLMGDDEEYNILGLEGQGLSLMAMAEYDIAGDKLSAVMDKDTTRWRTVNAIGILFTIRSNIKEGEEYYDEARQYFEEALALSPYNVSVINNYALMEALDGNYDESLDLLKDAAKEADRNSQDQWRVEMNQALVYAIKGELEDARKIASKHLTESQLMNNMGYYAYLADDEDMAKSYLNMALTNSPKHYEKAWKNLAAMEKLAGRKPSGSRKSN